MTRGGHGGNMMGWVTPLECSMVAYKLFRRDQQGGKRWQWGSAECCGVLDCFKMFNDSDDKVECLCVRIQQKTNQAEHPGLLQKTQQGSRGRWNTLISSWEECHNSWPTFSWGTYFRLAGNTIQQKGNSLCNYAQGVSEICFFPFVFNLFEEVHTALCLQLLAWSGFNSSPDSIYTPAEQSSQFFSLFGILEDSSQIAYYAERHLKNHRK